MITINRLKRMWNSPEGRLQIVKFGSIALLVGIIGSFILATIVFAVFSVGLPDPNSVIRREGFSTVIYDRNGKVLYDLYDKQNRIPLELSEMPKYLQEATISVEDKDFYKHQGIDPLGVFRIAKNLIFFRSLTGASTLTQQLVKNALLTSERTATRKIREVILSYQIEKTFHKDQILQLYLNEIPYGGPYYGVESAARGYFGKSAKNLNLVESAILAGLPQAPSTYSPFGSDPKAYIARTKHVLSRMHEDGFITAQQQADAEKQLPVVKFTAGAGSIKAPHFVFLVKDQLIAKFGEQMVQSGGLKVTTSLDYDLQEKAEQVVNEEVKKLKAAKASNGSAVVLNPKTGEILAMVGSYDFFDKDFGSYNIATALRQPGSSGKPFIYAAALTKGYTASSMLMDVKTDYPSGDANKPPYSPANYDLKYRGPIQLRLALGNSINTIAVKLTALVGLKNIMQTGFEAGISTWEPTAENMKNVGLSLALGGREVKLLELTSAYGSFATGGEHFEPLAILKVTEKSGNVVFENRAVAGKRVFTSEVSFIISHILSDNVARQDVFGAVNLLQIPGKTVAVKTGTTDLKRDNWTIGYTPSVVVGVWVGNNDNTVMSPIIASGVTGATPIWNKIMKLVLKDRKDEQFSKPESVKAVVVDSLGGGLPHGSDATRSEYFARGTDPIASAPIYRKIKIAKVDGKLANALQAKSGDFDEKEFIVVSESDPVSTDGKNLWQEAIDKWILDNRKDDARFHPPTETSSADINSVKINMESPHDHDQVNSNNVQVKVKAFSGHDIVKMTISVDGSEKVNKGTDNLDETIQLNNGKHEIKVRAQDSAGNSSEATVNIGVNQAWDAPVSSPSASLLFFNLNI